MAYYIFVGDMFVMAFMIAVVIWGSIKSSKETINKAARIPLEDEEIDG